jgi:arginase family enzyme
MPSLPTNFGLLEGAYCDYDRSRAVVLPVPFERTTTYGKGTSLGPAAILRASQSMELYDEARFWPPTLRLPFPWLCLWSSLRRSRKGSRRR